MVRNRPNSVIALVERRGQHPSHRSHLRCTLHPLNCRSEGSMRIKKPSSAFTLVELLVVIGIYRVADLHSPTGTW